MSEIVRMTSAEPVIYGAVKTVRPDGYERVADLRPVIAGRKSLCISS